VNNIKHLYWKNMKTNKKLVKLHPLKSWLMTRKQENHMPLFVSNKPNKLKNYSPFYQKKTKTQFSSTHLERRTSKSEELRLMKDISILKISKLISLLNNLKNFSVNMEMSLVLNSPTQTLALKNQTLNQPNMVLLSTNKSLKL